MNPTHKMCDVLEQAVVILKHGSRIEPQSHWHDLATAALADVAACPEGCAGCTLACPRLVRVILRGGPWDGQETQVTRAAKFSEIPHDAEGRLRSPGVRYFPTSEIENGLPVWHPSGVLAIGGIVPPQTMLVGERPSKHPPPRGAAPTDGGQQ